MLKFNVVFQGIGGLGAMLTHLVLMADAIRQQINIPDDQEEKKAFLSRFLLLFFVVVTHTSPSSHLFHCFAFKILNSWTINLGRPSSKQRRMDAAIKKPPPDYDPPTSGESGGDGGENAEAEQPNVDKKQTCKSKLAFLALYKEED